MRRFLSINRRLVFLLHQMILEFKLKIIHIFHFNVHCAFVQSIRFAALLSLNHHALRSRQRSALSMDSCLKKMRIVINAPNNGSIFLVFARPYFGKSKSFRVPHSNWIFRSRCHGVERYGCNKLASILHLEVFAYTISHFESMLELHTWVGASR